ncbi:MAG: TonB-dependent receptor plug domain-containing protein [Chitinophagaceae bacterium]
MKKLIGIFLCVVFINSSDAQTRNTPKDTEIINILDKHFSKLGSLALVNNSIQESNAKRKFFIQDNNLIIFYNDPNDVLTGRPVYDTTSLALNELGKILLTKGKGANGENGIGIEWVPKKNKLKTADESNASSSTIDQKQLAATSGTVVQKMQGQAAGVYVGNDNSPGGVPKVRIRGISSVNSNSNPLYIVDDVPINNINSINPDDIASVEVLKDASSTAMYGVRGANGVIIIKTKKGGYDDALPQEIKIQKELPYTLWIFGERASNFKNSPDSKRLLELLKEKIQDK